MSVNAYFKSGNPVERQISNLAYAEFNIRGRKCHSLEGFYQGIKRSGEDMQHHIFFTHGLNAKNMSKPTKFAYFDGIKFNVGSLDHHKLILEAQICKYTQDRRSFEALMSTGQASITHNVGRDSEVYPAKVYCKHLTKIRSMLFRGELNFVGVQE